MDDHLAKTIGSAARSARLARGLTQEDAADIVGVSLEFYARIERGKTLPSVPTLLRLAAALGVSADVLLGLDRLSDTARFAWRRPTLRLRGRLGASCAGSSRRARRRCGSLPCCSERSRLGRASQSQGSRGNAERSIVHRAYWGALVGIGLGPASFGPPRRGFAVINVGHVEPVRVVAEVSVARCCATPFL